MRIALHIGLHGTDEGRLLEGLQKNAAALSGAGICIPDAARYRPLLRDALVRREGHERPDGAALLAQILGQDTARALVLSHENLICVPKMALSEGRPYARIGARLQDLSALFAGHRIELFLALRNPAGWLPALHAQVQDREFEALMAGLDPLMLRWPELVARIRDAVPDMDLTIWCNEDTPLIWAELLRRMAGLPATAPVAGGWDLLGDILAPEGMTRFQAFLAGHPGLGEAPKRRAAEALLDKFALSGALSDNVDVPGWDPELVDMLTELYLNDVEQIATRGDVRLIRP